MRIPKYVQEMLKRSEYDFNGDVGYTIKIHKATYYTKAETLQKEVEKLVAWVNKQVEQIEGLPTAFINRIPVKTHYTDQVAVVTIYDPVMNKLEGFIEYDPKRRF